MENLFKMVLKKMFASSSDTEDDDDFLGLEKEHVRYEDEDKNYRRMMSLFDRQTVNGSIFQKSDGYENSDDIAGALSEKIIRVRETIREKSNNGQLGQLTEGEARIFLSEIVLFATAYQVKVFEEECEAERRARRRAEKEVEAKETLVKEKTNGKEDTTEDLDEELEL